MVSDSVNKQWLVTGRPQGKLDDSIFELRESKIPEPGDGEFLIQTIYLTITPPLRMWLDSGGLGGVPIPLGDVMRGGGLEDRFQGSKESVIREMAMGIKHVVLRPHGRAQ